MATTFLEDYFDHSANLSQSSASFRFTGRHQRHLRPQECLRLCFHIFVESHMVSGDSNCEAKTMFGPSVPLGPNMNKHRCMCKVYCTKKREKNEASEAGCKCFHPALVMSFAASICAVAKKQQSCSREVQPIYPQIQSRAELSCQSCCFTLFL